MWTSNYLFIHNQDIRNNTHSDLHQTQHHTVGPGTGGEGTGRGGVMRGGMVVEAGLCGTMQLFKLHWSGMPDFTGRCPPPSVDRSTSSELVAFNLFPPRLPSTPTLLTATAFSLSATSLLLQHPFASGVSPAPTCSHF